MAFKIPTIKVLATWGGYISGISLGVVAIWQFFLLANGVIESGKEQKDSNARIELNQTKILESVAAISQEQKSLKAEVGVTNCNVSNLSGEFTKLNSSYIQHLKGDKVNNDILIQYLESIAIDLKKKDPWELSAQ